MTEQFLEDVRRDLFADEETHENFVALMRESKGLSAWRDELVKLIQSIEAQGARARAEEAGDRADSYAGRVSRAGFEQRCAERGEWRHRALVMKKNAVTRLAEVKDLIRDTNVAEATKADQSNFKILFRAVAAHRKASIEGDYEPETHDLDLWSVYDDIRANNHTQAHAL